MDLGFVAERAAQWLTNSYFPSKLGGKPAWLDLSKLPETLLCKTCKQPKSFLCQIYAPFDDDYNFHRTIFVFACRTESCYIPNDGSNFTVLRSQLPLKNEYYPAEPAAEDGVAVAAIQPQNYKLCAACGCLAPLKCGRCKLINYCGAVHQRLHWKYHKMDCSTESKQTTTTTTNDFISEILFPEYEIVIDANDGDEDMPKKVVNEQEQMRELEKLTLSDKAGELQDIPESELEKYTSGCETTEDKYFLKFRKECDKDPEQIIRYKRGGQPLWIADVDTTIAEQLANTPNCQNCNSRLQFEFEILPQMLNYLKDSNMDWGVLAIYTCPLSCQLPSGKSYIEEFLIKQDILANNHS